MPATSQQQQKLFGLALAVKRGEVSPSEVSDEVRDIVDRMSEKDIEDFAGTSHTGLPYKVEAKLRETLRELMRDNVLNEEDPCWKGYQQIGMKTKNGKEVPNCVPESVNEAAANPATKKFLKGMQSIKVNGLGGYMPGVRNVYWDKKDKKFWFVDFEGDHMELLNTSTLKQLDAHIKKSNIKLESVNEASVSKLYSTFLDVENKLKELEATQKEMAKKYFDEKDAKKKADLLDKLKKGTKVLQATRKTLSDVEAKYVMGLDKDAEFQGESVNESVGCGCGCGCGGSKMNEALKADPRKVYGGTGAKEGMVLVKQAGFIKVLELSKKNPSNVFVVSDDNYTNFGPFYVKNGKVAKYTVANPNYDLEKNKVRSVKVPNDVILKFKVVE